MGPTPAGGWKCTRCDTRAKGVSPQGKHTFVKGECSQYKPGAEESGGGSTTSETAKAPHVAGAAASRGSKAAGKHGAMDPLSGLP